MTPATVCHGVVLRESDPHTFTVQLDGTSTFVSVHCHAVVVPPSEQANLHRSEFRPGAPGVHCSVALGPFCFEKYAFVNCVLVSPPMGEGWGIEMARVPAVAAAPFAKKNYGGMPARRPFNPPVKNTGIVKAPARPVPKRIYHRGPAGGE
jgi:hypothetical protein